MNERKQYPYQEEEPKVIALSATKTAPNFWMDLMLGVSVLAYGMILLALH